MHYNRQSRIHLIGDTCSGQSHDQHIHGIGALHSIAASGATFIVITDLPIV